MPSLIPSVSPMPNPAASAGLLPGAEHNQGNPGLTGQGRGVPPHFGAATLPQAGGVTGGALPGAHNPTHPQTKEEAAAKATAQAKYDHELAVYNKHIDTKMNGILRSTIAEIAYGGAQLAPLLHDVHTQAYQPMAKAYSAMPHAHVLKLLEEFKASPSLPVAPPLPSSADDTTTPAAPEPETQALDHLIAAIKNITEEDWNNANIDAESLSDTQKQKKQLLMHVNTHIVHRNMVGMHADLPDEQKTVIGNEYQTLFSDFIQSSNDSSNTIEKLNTAADALLAHQQLFQKRRAYLLLKDFLIPPSSTSTQNEADNMMAFVTEMSKPNFDIHKKIDDKKLSAKRQALIDANKDDMGSYLTQYEPTVRLYQMMLQWLQALQAQAAAKTAPTDLVGGLKELTNTLKELIPEGGISEEIQEKIQPILGGINDLMGKCTNDEQGSAAQYQDMVQKLGALLKDKNIDVSAYEYLKDLSAQAAPTVAPNNLVEQLKELTAGLQGLIPQEGSNAVTEAAIQPILGGINELLGKCTKESIANEQGSAIPYQTMLGKLLGILKSYGINNLGAHSHLAALIADQRSQ